MAALGTRRRLAGFARTLRDNGYRVGLAETRDALQVLTSPAALRRAVTFGSGWLSGFQTPREFAASAAALAELAAAAGRPELRLGVMLHATLGTGTGRSDTAGTAAHLIGGVGRARTRDGRGIRR